MNEGWFTIPPAVAQWLSVWVHNGMCELSAVCPLTCVFFIIVDGEGGTMEFSAFVKELVKASQATQSEEVPKRVFWQPWLDEGNLG